MLAVIIAVGRALRVGVRVCSRHHRRSVEFFKSNCSSVSSATTVRGIVVPFRHLTTVPCTLMYIYRAGRCAVARGRGLSYRDTLALAPHMRNPCTYYAAMQ